MVQDIKQRLSYFDLLLCIYLSISPDVHLQLPEEKEDSFHKKEIVPSLECYVAIAHLSHQAGQYLGCGVFADEATLDEGVGDVVEFFSFRG